MPLDQSELDLNTYFATQQEVLLQKESDNSLNTLKVRNLTKSIWPLQLILLAGVFLIYGQSIGFDYNLDDEIVLQPASAFSWDGVAAALTEPYYNQAGAAYGYRPVTSLSFYLQAALLGNQPWIGHLINILLYSSIVLLLFQITKSLSNSVAVAFGIAMLFCVHPLHTEVVASIKNRDELLALLFGLLGFLALDLKSFWKVLALMIGIFLSLMAKKTGLTLFLVAPAVVHAYGRINNLQFWMIGAYMTALLIALAPLPDLSDSLFIAGAYLIALAGYYIWDQVHSRLWNYRWVCDAFALLGGIAVIYCWLVSFSSTILLLAFALNSGLFAWRKRISNLIALWVSAGTLSFFTESWYLLPWLFYTLHPDRLQHKPLRYMLAGVLVMLTCQQLLASNKPWSIAIGMIYGLPLALANMHKYVRWVVVASATIALGINVFTFKDPVYVIFLAAIVAYQLTPNKLHRKPYAWTTAILVLVLAQTAYPPYISGKDKLQQLHTLESTDQEQISQSGRSLDYIENPLATQQSLANHAVAGANTYLHYFKQFWAPTNLSMYYGFQTIDVLSYGMALWSLLVFGCLMLLLIWLRCWNLLTLLALWAVTLLPFSNLYIPMAGIVGDRLSFFASIFMAGFALLAIQKIRHTKLKQATFAIIILALGFLSFQRTSLWKDKETLYLHDVSVWPHSVKLNQLAGDLLYNKGITSQSAEELQKAYGYFQQGAQTHPPYYLNWYMMGLIKQQLGNPQQALEHYQKVEDSEYVNQNIHLNMAICATLSSDYQLAERYYTRAIGFEPTRLQAYLNMVFMYLKTNELTKALGKNQEALNSFPDNASLHENHARIYYQLDSIPQTIHYLEQAIALGKQTPSNTEFLAKLKAQIEER
ncbi:Tfp pilus assembly protein PilF [Marinoscillum furvescens DSM 4134]|uniref:Tfp pilus assembly protein PilF n=2 Tax=Marinoscillum furvescens TaxID=1026 RepID=A0A3D9KXF7_MARFU|nr:Tfp pilus assembly protein PilF [Marinoscillum furvescens DSM 4134]